MNAPMTRQRSGLAVASLVLGLISLPLVLIFVGVLLAIPAVICGHVALFKIKKSAGAIMGRSIAIAGLAAGYLAVVLFPIMIIAVNNALVTTNPNHNPSFQMLSRGKQIFMCATTGMGPIIFDCWPKAGTVPDSTAFFTNMVGSGQIKVDYSFFSAQGITPSRGKNAALFTAKNNAWCVVADVHDEDSDKIPYLFTRNLNISSLAELKGRVGDQLSDESPFGRKGVPVIFKSGFAEILTPDMLWSNILGGQTFTNRVLRP